MWISFSTVSYTIRYGPQNVCLSRLRFSGGVLKQSMGIVEPIEGKSINWLAVSSIFIFHRIASSTDNSNRMVERILIKSCFA